MESAKRVPPNSPLFSDLQVLEGASGDCRRRQLSQCHEYPKLHLPSRLSSGFPAESRTKSFWSRPLLPRKLQKSTINLEGRPSLTLIGPSSYRSSWKMNQLPAFQEDPSRLVNPSQRGKVRREISERAVRSHIMRPLTPTPHGPRPDEWDITPRERYVDDSETEYQ